MKKLYGDLLSFSNEVIKFQHELEDNMGSPLMASTLKAYRTRIKSLLAYEPKFSEHWLELEDAKAAHYRIVLALTDCLHDLETVNKDSIVYDIIDVIRRLYNTLEHCLPENNDIIYPPTW